MPRKLRSSLTALVAIALASALASSSAHAQKWSSNRPLFNQSNQPKGYIGRNDGYVQQNKSVNSVKGTKQQRGGNEREIMDKMMRQQH